MLLATLLAFASVGDVTLPGVDPPARSSEAPIRLFKSLGGYRIGRTVVAPPFGDTTLKLLFFLSFVCNVVSGKRKRGVSVQTVSSDSDDDGDKTATIVVGSIALTCICTWLKGQCSSNDEERNASRSRPQTDPNAIIVEMESASFSASVRQTAGKQSNGVPPAPFVTMWPASGVEPGATNTSNGAPSLTQPPVPPPPQQQPARNLNKATALREARREARQSAGERRARYIAQPPSTAREATASSFFCQRRDMHI